VVVFSFAFEEELNKKKMMLKTMQVKLLQ